MPVLSILGIDVKFPFEPYPCQISYMEKVISALSTSSNALLESPTGTGKTICLLCATLAWQDAMQPKALQIKYSSEPTQSKPKIELLTNQSVSKPMQQPAQCTIIYSSRTHSQLSQVISELRASGYSPRMTVMGSRDQLCIHPKLSRMRGAALNHACNTLNAQRGCSFKNNLDNYSGAAEGVAGAASPILDIEQLATLGKEDKVCPYFFSRETSTRAQLILLPYNYLMEASIRATMKVEWNNAIVILDEAHNIEKNASDASSCCVTSSELASCIGELQQVIKLLRTKENEVSVKPHRPDGNEISKALKGSMNNSSNCPSLARVAEILTALFEFERRLDDIPLSKPGSNAAIPAGPNNGPSTVMPGHALARILDASGFALSKIADTIKELKQCSDFLLDESELLMGNAAVAEPKLSLLHKAFEKIFKGTDMRAIEAASSQYKVFIYEEIAQQRGVTKSKPKRVVQYWCFTPGVAMEEIKKLGVRSFILTSGTLSPMDSFREDLKLPFNVVLENPHVIKDKQLWISAISTGPRGKQLNSSYNNRDLSEYKDDLGGSILMICREMLGSRTVPRIDGGVLVFFPTYAVMDSAVQRWHQTGLWEQLSGACGKIVIEGKAASNVKTKAATKPFIAQRVASKLQDIDNDDTSPDSAQVVASTVQDFEAALQTYKKCLLLAVCRGKVSEGIDFKDSKGRVAIITGIPFAPFLDPWVVLKKQYLDDSSKKPIATGVPKQLNGQGWYVQSASRSVNQAVGRVIRHQKDWGAVFLLDNRFASDGQRSQLSGWVRPRLRKYDSITKSIESFRAFLVAAASDPELQEAVEIAPPARVSRIPPNLTPAAPTSEFQRQVVLPSAAISSEEEVAYIEPSLLMSQRSNQEGFLITKSTGKTNSSSSSSFKEPDLGDLLSKIKHARPTSNTSLSQPASQDIRALFNRKNVNDIPTSSSIDGRKLLSNKRTDTTFKPMSSSSFAKPIAYKVGLCAGESITGHDGDVCLNVSQSQAQKPFINPLKRSQTTSSTWEETFSTNESDIQTTSIKKEPAAVLTKGPSKEDFKALIGHLQGVLSATQFSSFMEAIKSASNPEKSTVLANEHEVLTFVNKVIKILKNTLPSREIRSTMKRISFLIPAFLIKTYSEAVEDALSEAGKATSTVADTGRDIDSLTQDSSERYSKRAKLMLSGSQRSTSQLSGQSVTSSVTAARSMLNNVSNFSMTKSSGSESSTSHSSLTCSICNSRAVVPCAGRCGHVCCEQCWSSWLRIKKSCPLCRQPTVAADVSRIIVK